ncbi:hypothetical protein AX15_000919 [Amanita polypyramis BW_CC]|nr:hypothetical protein AX15_000919 [Amanita polypyramis BW_CC]
MVSRKSQLANFTLFFYFALLVLFASSADASSHVQPNHRRLLKKRMPQVLGFPTSPTAQNTATGTSSPASVKPSASGKTTATFTSVTPTTVGQTSTTPLTSTTNTDTTGSASSSGTSSSPSSTSPTSTSGLPSTSTSSSTFSSTGIPTHSIPSASVTPDALTQTETVSGVSPSASTQVQETAAESSHKKTTFTVIIAVASSIGAIAILWTLFRKWKLARSSKFDDRLQPIDWQPPSEDARRRPVSSASSFHSGINGFGSEQGNEHVQNSTLAPLPEHDFTALPSSHLAAVGGYADLARGPSPQPQMQEAYGRHSPITGRPNYDVSVPLHHQAGYGGRDAYDYTNYNNNTSLRY